MQRCSLDNFLSDVDFLVSEFLQVVALALDGGVLLGYLAHELPVLFLGWNVPIVVGLRQALGNRGRDGFAHRSDSGPFFEHFRLDLLHLVRCH